MSDNKKINMDSYSIQDEWINNVAPTYFDIDTQNMLRVGLLGYINEVQSNIVEDSHNLANVYYNELLPVRASLPETIYTNASIVKYNDFHAKPASAYFTLAISTEDLKERSIAKIDHREFYIAKNSYFSVDDRIDFMIEYPIIIKCKQLKSDEWIFTPIYDLSLKNNLNDIHTPYINSVVNKINNEEFLFMNIKASQVTHTRKIFDVYSNNIIDNLIYNIDFSGKLSHFNIYYDDILDPDAGLKNITPYFVDNLNPEDDRFCFYKILGPNNLEISFSAYEHYFRPDIGSSLIIDIYTTLGEEGNFNYYGANTVFTFGIDKYVKQSLEMNYKRISQVATMETASRNGRDEYSLQKIKKKVIDEMSMRKSIVTEGDLNNYFNDFREDSSIQFIKKRDDILQRLFAAYILFKDSDKNMIPTNTVDLKINESVIDTYSNNQNLYMYKAGKLLQLEKNTFNLYRNTNNVLSTNDILALEEKGDFFVSNPFLMRFSFDPITVSYYFNSINQIYKNIYTFVNKNSYHEFAINEVSIVRNAYKTDDYKISLNLSTNLNMNKMFDANNRDTELVKIKGIFKANNQMLGYIDFKPTGYFSNNKIIYESKITSTDFIDIDEMMEFENSIKIEENGKGITLPSSFLPYKDLKLEICCFYKEKLPSSNNIVQRLSSLSELNEYTLVNLYETEQEIKLFQNLDSIINSKLVVSRNTKNEFDFRIKSSPVIRYSYLKEMDPDNLIDILNDYIITIENSLDKLENNFDIDLKFANTYGKSKWFVIGDGGNYNSTIDRTNISLNFRIKTCLQIDSDNIREIKQFIIKFIEDINSSNESNTLYISNLIRAIESNFDYITFVHFIGINEYDSTKQVIENMDNLKNISREELYDYVPEYINLHKKIEYSVSNSNERSTSGNVVFNPEVNIEFI